MFYIVNTFAANHDWKPLADLAVAVHMTGVEGGVAAAAVAVPLALK